ncbi:Preprotein translocase SecG subunit [marine gamma proteobacterium HTCC2143]|jgi:preprotein translocase subunit SecG|uniref:Protein-export membrane protein SecG n=1 Tax=marine gamma proteobacterium HTCC2143 TaxID=247633 RepID=A0YEX5_9GAMM|nr:Preprotein translocase SecG subunit [marine gamma proteobacterium HTCC2143]
MEQIVLIVHVLVALAIIGLIMIQQGKGADMGASFGAGASQTLFGSGGGGNVLTSATSWLVTLFFATSFGLAVIAKENSMAAGNVDLPMPAVIESFEMPADVRESDIPGVDAAVFEEIPGADVPVEGSGSDIPGL